jgi:hypothetical protein
MSIEMQDGVPVMRCKVGKGGHSWEFDCPYCGRRHMHSPEEGHRVPHCGSADHTVFDTWGSYYLKLEE